jgi:hypothetical protein
MNVKRLDGALLNFWVAKAAGLHLSPVEPRGGERHEPDSGFWHPTTYSPSTDWSQAGAIVSNDWFAIEDMLLEWFGADWTHIQAVVDHPLQWFMRAFVATQYGNEVEDSATAQALQIQHGPGGSAFTNDRKPAARMPQWFSHLF